MSLMPAAQRLRIQRATLFLGSTILLFLGFFSNYWGVVPRDEFVDFQRDSESLVMARMVESRQNGPFAHNALLGWGDSDPLELADDDYLHQYETFLSDQGFQTYSLYKSASGGQALLFSTLHELSPCPPAIDLRNFRGLVALLLAVSLSLFMVWLGDEFGVLIALFVTATTLFSQWITLYGRNLFYFIWASFLPLAGMVWHLAGATGRQRTSDWGLAGVAFISILFKCLANGYDFILPVLSMPFAPLAYYAVRDRWPLGRVIRRSSLLLLGMAAALGVSIVVLASQLQVSEGTFWGGLNSIFGTLGRRTYFADPALLPDYVSAVASTPLSAVLWTYLSQGSAVLLIGLRFLDLLGIFAGVTVAYWILYRLQPDRFPDQRKSTALIVVTWLSVLAPFSWFIVFKGQAVVHTHTNYLAWHMPFTLLGYAMLAWLLRCIGVALLRGGMRSRDQGALP
jgi:hypothetical protein